MEEEELGSLIEEVMGGKDRQKMNVLKGGWTTKDEIEDKSKKKKDLYLMKRM